MHACIFYEYRATPWPKTNRLLVFALVFLQKTLLRFPGKLDRQVKTSPTHTYILSHPGIQDTQAVVLMTSNLYELILNTFSADTQAILFMIGISAD